MSPLYLVRHGSTAWSGARYCGRSDPALNAEGLAEVERLAAQLRPVVAGGARIVTSPLRRAQQTARGLGRCRVTVDPRLVEVDLGRAEGLTFDELSARWPAVAAALLRDDHEFDWPDGERWRDVSARVASFCADIERSAAVIAVTHGIVARAIAARIARGRAPETLAPATAIVLPL